MPRKLLTIVGARPQFVKAATITRALRDEPAIDEILVHTGQHYDEAMSEIFFRELEIPAPAYNLEVHGGGHGDMTGRMLMALEPVMMKEAPDAVLIYGDTNSTLAGALTASKLHIPVFHVEAGLRSFNRRMPEEINRVLADHLSALLLCPTTTAVTNLANEGITEGVLNVGDVMYDATLHVRDVGLAKSDIITRLGLTDGAYTAMTMHRAENTDDPKRLAEIIAYVERTAKATPVVFPVHPRTSAALDRIGYAGTGLMRIAPVGYTDMHRLLAGAAEVFTDSGGLQKEAYFHRVPCVTLREETEWVETIASGWNRLWTTPDYAPRCDIAEYGDGTASKVIVDAMKQWFEAR